MAAETPKGHTQTLMTSMPETNMIEIALPKPTSTVRPFAVPSTGPVKLYAAMAAKSPSMSPQNSSKEVNGDTNLVPQAK